MLTIAQDWERSGAILCPRCTRTESAQYCTHGGPVVPQGPTPTPSQFLHGKLPITTPPNPPSYISQPTHSPSHTIHLSAIISPSSAPPTRPFPHSGSGPFLPPGLGSDTLFETTKEDLIPGSEGESSMRISLLCYCKEHFGIPVYLPGYVKQIPPGSRAFPPSAEGSRFGRPPKKKPTPECYSFPWQRHRYSKPALL